MSSRPRTLLVVALWAATIVGWFAYQRASGSSTTEVAQRFVDAASGSWWAIAAYAVLAVVRPVVLFPATVLTVVAGVLFGAVLGVVVAALAANASALIAYHLGRRLRRPPGGARSASDGEMSRIEAWTQRLRANGFESVLLMRLLFLPYDPVSYVCGLVRVPVQQFLGAGLPLQVVVLEHPAAGRGNPDDVLLRVAGGLFGDGERQRLAGPAGRAIGHRELGHLHAGAEAVLRPPLQPFTGIGEIAPGKGDTSHTPHCYTEGSPCKAISADAQRVRCNMR